MLAWSLEAFSRSSAVAAAVVAAPAGAEAAVEELAAALTAEPGAGEPAGAPSLTVRVVAGGASRSESVARASELVESELVAVHDAARPLATPALIDGVVAKLASRPDAAGVIAALPLADTVKRAREPRSPGGDVPREGPTVARTESREHLWAAQTPQAFRLSALREALDGAPQRLAAATDDAMLVESAGGKVLIHPGSPENLKITTPFDLRIAELLLRERVAG